MKTVTPHQQVGLTFAAFSAANRKRSEKDFKRQLDSRDAVFSMTIGLSEEAGEVAGEVRALLGFSERKTGNKEKVGKEAADLIAYADLLLQSIGLSLEEWVIRKFNEVSDRIGSDVKLGEAALVSRNDICARPKCESPRHYNIHDPERGGHEFVEPSLPVADGISDGVWPTLNGTNQRLKELRGKVAEQEADLHDVRGSVTKTACRIDGRIDEVIKRLAKLEPQTHPYDYDGTGCRRCGGPTTASHTIPHLMTCEKTTPPTLISRPCTCPGSNYGG